MPDTILSKTERLSHCSSGLLVVKPCLSRAVSFSKHISSRFKSSQAIMVLEKLVVN